MARYSTSIVSQTAQLAGMPATTTVNGYIGYWGGSATSGYRLRRVTLGVRTTSASVPTSQQYTVEVHRQTVAPSGTGLAAAVLGQPLETWTPQTDPTVGMIATTATTIGTTGPTLTAAPIKTLTLNTQNTVDYPFEFLEELVCAIGTANGLAFVNIGNTLPAGHLITVDVEIEV
jgi:hypothetical protein